MSAFFVTATDTDAGKTTVARALLAAARARALSCVGYKPVESGSPRANAPGPDATALARAAAGPIQTTYAFQPPIAPARAAELSGATVSLQRIREHNHSLAKSHELLITEGAGGFLVPCSPEHTLADIAVDLAMPLLVVVPDRLGSINHALLTAEAIRARGLTLRALILNELEPGAGQGLDNRQQLERHSGIEVLPMPHCASEDALRGAGSRLLDALLADAEA